MDSIAHSIIQLRDTATTFGMQITLRQIVTSMFCGTTVAISLPRDDDRDGATVLFHARRAFQSSIDAALINHEQRQIGTTIPVAAKFNRT